MINNFLNASRHLNPSLDHPVAERTFIYLGAIRSAALDRVIEQATAVAPYRSISVLLTGQRGVGKELMAKSLHHAYRPEEPFCDINCAVCPPSLAESELFGHERGAFTGAHERKLGLLETTKSGTLFLDEVADLYPEVQAKLLRAFQERKFRRVGGHTVLPFLGRVLSATNRDLWQLANEGKFRLDLVDRIADTVIHLPPLAEQRNIVGTAFRHFVSKFCREEGITPEIVVDDDVEPVLLSLPWPGNFRELNTVAKNAAAKSRGGVIRGELVSQIASATNGVTTRLRSVHLLTPDMVRLAVSATPNQTAAAHELGIPLGTLRSLAPKAGISLKRDPRGRRKK